MDEQQVRKIIKEEVARWKMESSDRKGNQGSPFVPVHTHNGVDNTRINEDDLTLGTKYMTQFDSANSTFDENGINRFSLNNVLNISRIVFKGFVADNLVSAASKRAVITGEALFGVPLFIGGAAPNVSFVSVAVNANGTNNFVQTSNSLYIDAASISNTRVSLSPALAFAVASTGVIAYLKITAYSKSTISFEMFIAPGANWRFQGQLVIT